MPPAAMPFSRILEMPSWLIGRASAHSHRLLVEGFAAAGARGYHHRLLAALEEFGPARPGKPAPCEPAGRPAHARCLGGPRREDPARSTARHRVGGVQDASR